MRESLVFVEVGPGVVACLGVAEVLFFYRCVFGIDGVLFEEAFGHDGGAKDSCELFCAAVRGSEIGMFYVPLDSAEEVGVAYWRGQVAVGCFIYSGVLHDVCVVVLEIGENLFAVWFGDVVVRHPVHVGVEFLVGEEGFACWHVRCFVFEVVECDGASEDGCVWKDWFDRWYGDVDGGRRRLWCG